MKLYGQSSSRAEGGVTSPSATAVQEIAAGIWSRAFAAVKVEPESLPSGPSAYPRCDGDDREQSLLNER